MQKINRICICGGGNLGLICAGIFLSNGIRVSLLTGKPNSWQKTIKVYDPNGKEFGGTIDLISSEPKDVIPTADIVLLTIPGFLFESTLTAICPYLNKETIVGSIVASTGFFFYAHEILGDKHSLFGFQRVPYIARQIEYGKVGELLGYKSHLSICIENYSKKEELKDELEKLFRTPILLLDNYLEVSLTNSNPILHTGRLYTLWKDYNGEVFEKPSLFYADWDNEASSYLIKMDEEFQLLLRQLGIKNGIIPPLLEYYESTDADTLTKKIKSIPAFKSIQTPMKKVGHGWIPDFNSRYFTEDIPFGLRFIYDLAKEHKIPTPTIDKVYEWGMRIIKEKS